MDGREQGPEDEYEDETPDEGVWTLRHADPTLESRLILEGPTEASVRAIPADGAPKGERTSSGAPAAVIYSMKKTEPSPSPAGDDPAADLPRVTWSTFASWRELGRSMTAAFEENLTLDPHLDAGAALESAEPELRTQLRALEHPGLDQTRHLRQAQVAYERRFAAGELDRVD